MRKLTAAVLLSLLPTVAWAEIPTDLTVPNTFSIQLKGPDVNPSTLDQVAATGFKYVRRGFIWDAVEKTPGVYDFTLYDRTMAEFKARGLSVIACIAFKNENYGDTVLTEEGRQAYARYAAALVARYKDYDVMWEVWNEPNVRTFWGKHGTHNSVEYARQYTDLVKVAVPAMKRANPNCTVLGGAVSGIWSASVVWMTECFRLGILDTGIDGWSVHPYNGRCPEDHLPLYQLVREMMAKAGHPNLPLLNTERGYPLGKAEGFAGGDASKSKEYQANHFVRQYLTDLTADIRVSSWYEWGGKEGFALRPASGEQSPALVAAQTLAKELSGYRFDANLTPHPLPPPNLGAGSNVPPGTEPRDFVLRFKRPDGTVKLVAWTAQPASTPPDKLVPHTVDIPLSAFGVALAEPFGKITSVSIDGKATVLTATGSALPIELTGAPQYISVVP